MDRQEYVFLFLFASTVRHCNLAADSSGLHLRAPIRHPMVRSQALQNDYFVLRISRRIVSLGLEVTLKGFAVVKVWYVSGQAPGEVSESRVIIVNYAEVVVIDEPSDD